MTFKIYSKPHTMFAAIHLANQLKKLGHAAIVVREIDLTDKTIYIIYNASSLNALPKNYIIYQTEVATSQWFNARYYNYLAGALAVWEYDESNIHKYNKLNKRIAIVSPGVMPQVKTQKDIPVLFYGWIKGSARREQMLKHLGKQVTVATDLFERDIWKLLSRAHIVLNIHYYPQAPLEAFRVNEALSFNCHVISERSLSGDEKYTGIIKHFGNEWELSKLITECKGIEFDKDLTKLDNTHEISHALKLCN